MPHIKISEADLFSLKALENYALSHNEASETLYILFALVTGTDKSYNALSHPAKMVYLAIAEKEAIHE